MAPSANQLTLRLRLSERRRGFLVDVLDDVRVDLNAVKSPEKRTALAVLVDALARWYYTFVTQGNSTQGFRPGRPRLQIRARAALCSWFRGDPGAPLSFEDVCVLLGIDQDRILRKLVVIRAEARRAAVEGLWGLWE